MRMTKCLPVALLALGMVLGVGQAVGVGQAGGSQQAEAQAAPLNPQLTAQQKAQQREDARYPLRLHVLAIDDVHRTVRLQPAWCSASAPVVSDTGTASPGDDACGGAGTASLGGGDDDFSGSGRGDLVTPPDGTRALSFKYEGCYRMRVPPGFTGLPARWKKPGKLEVLIPTDRLSGDSHTDPDKLARCTVTVKLEEFVYLRMPNGSLLKVSQEAYTRKPALRVFLSGGSEALQQRIPAPVSVKELMSSRP